MSHTVLQAQVSWFKNAELKKQLWMKGDLSTNPEGYACNCALHYGKFAEHDIFWTKYLQQTDPAFLVKLKTLELT